MERKRRESRLQLQLFCAIVLVLAIRPSAEACTCISSRNNWRGKLESFVTVQRSMHDILPLRSSDTPTLVVRPTLLCLRHAPGTGQTSATERQTVGQHARDHLDEQPDLQADVAGQVTLFVRPSTARARLAPAALSLTPSIARSTRHPVRPARA